MSDFVNWLEWSGVHQSMHTNGPGKAEDTLLGDVSFIPVGKTRLDADRKKWRATRRDGSEVGKYDTSTEAQAALMKDLDLFEIS
jgi:hypothetical protein